MMILIVEDEPQVAMVLREMIELNPAHWVTAVVEDLAGAIEAIDRNHPDLAVVDIQLARGSSGFSVADALRERGIQCLLATATPPPFEMPELALGCLPKPYSTQDVFDALKAAEDGSRGQASPDRPHRYQPYLPSIDETDHALN